MIPCTYTLELNGRQCQLSADHTIRFVSLECCGLAAVLYDGGKRVTEAWSLRLEYDSERDPHKNANTA